MIDLNLFKSSAIGVVVLGLVACGGGGGGGGPAPISYDGVTDQAKITVDNSEELTEASIDGASPADSGIANATEGGPEQDSPQLLGIAKNLGKILKRVDLSQNTGDQVGTAQVISDSGSETSECGGSFSYGGTVDDVSGNFSANFTYSNYVDCDDKSVIDGSFSATGTASLSTREIRTMNITFSNLNYKEGDESMGMDGTMNFVFYGSISSNVTMDMDFVDNTNGKTYRVENYVVELYEGGGFERMVITGNVYHPDYGYVKVQTINAVYFYNSVSRDYPFSGLIELTGSNGTKVVVNFSGSTYQESIYTDSDGIADAYKNCNWTTNSCI